MGNPDQPPHSTVSTDDVPPDVLKKAVAASAIGNATEWFDYGIYAYGVTYISAAIFPMKYGVCASVLFSASLRGASGDLAPPIVPPVLTWSDATGPPMRSHRLTVVR